MSQNQQNENITLLRSKNYSYRQIAAILQLPVNTVKSVCRRSGIAVAEEYMDSPAATRPQEQLIQCRYCGKLVNNLWNRKNKTFCSDKCRYDFWNREKRLNKNESPK